MKENRFLAIISVLVLLVILPHKATSQIMEVGVTGGLSYYIGDINPKKHFNQSDLGLGVAIRYYQNLRWAFRFQYTNMSLKSSDDIVGFRPERGLAFNSKVNDFAFLAEFNFFDYWTGSNRNYFTPYLVAGISIFNFNSYAPDGVALQPLQTEGVAYNSLSWSIPFGIGIKYSLTKRIGITLEWIMHKAFTDYIDDIHGLYPEPSDAVSDYSYTDPTGISKPGMQRGNGTSSSLGYNYDWYGMLGFSVLYRFNLPKKEVCNSGVRGASK